MASSGAAGAGVDSEGRPVLDPTKNVLDLVEAAIARQDDLRAAERELRRTEMRRQDDMRQADSDHIREVAAIRHHYEGDLRKAETARIDAIREVDQAAVQRAADVQAAQAGALATQVVATADAFRAGLTAALEPIIKDIADLRKTQYEQAGRQVQTGESRLNLGSVFGALSLVLVLVLGVIQIASR